MKVIAALNDQIVDLTMNMHGNHVLQQFLMVFKASNEPTEQDSKECALTDMYT